MRCYVLKEVSRKKVERRQSRLDHIKRAFTLSGYEVIELAEDVMNVVNLTSLEQQQGEPEFEQVAYAQAIFNLFESRQYPPGLIVATEPWHGQCFKGMLKLGHGFFCDCPVVEAWIDYPTSFARYRIFPTQFNLGFAAATEKKTSVNQDWVKINYPLPEVSTPVKFSKEEVDEVNPFGLRALPFMAIGQPVVAPDYGSWPELIVHGVSGALFRTEEGKKKAITIAQSIPATTVANYAKATFSVERAAASLAGFLKRVKNA